MTKSVYDYAYIGFELVCSYSPCTPEVRHSCELALQSSIKIINTQTASNYEHRLTLPMHWLNFRFHGMCQPAMCPESIEIEVYIKFIILVPDVYIVLAFAVWAGYSHSSRSLNFLNKDYPGIEHFSPAQPCNTDSTKFRLSSRTMPKFWLGYLRCRTVQFRPLSKAVRKISLDLLRRPPDVQENRRRRTSCSSNFICALALWFASCPMFVPLGWLAYGHGVCSLGVCNSVRVVFIGARGVVNELCSVQFLGRVVWKYPQF